MDVEANLEIVEENLAAVEHLLSMSLRGFHFAFEKSDIKDALGAPINGISEFEHEDRERVQKIFLSFVQKKTLSEKRAYMESLVIMDKELVIKAYFNILENTLKKCSLVFH